MHGWVDQQLPNQIRGGNRSGSQLHSDPTTTPDHGTGDGNVDVLPWDPQKKNELYMYLHRKERTQKPLLFLLVAWCSEPSFICTTLINLLQHFLLYSHLALSKAWNVNIPPPSLSPISSKHPQKFLPTLLTVIFTLSAKFTTLSLCVRFFFFFYFFTIDCRCFILVSLPLYCQIISQLKNK